MPGPTTKVVITLEGVRPDHVPRLRTVIKSELTRFGRTIKVEDGLKPVAEKVPKTEGAWKGKRRKKS